MMTLETAFADTSYDLELERIKNKITKLYNDLVEKTFRQANPGAPQDQLESFLESNALEFKDGGFDEESDGLERMLDLLTQDEELDKVSDKTFKAPEVAQGKEPKDKAHNRLFTPTTKSLEYPRGGLFTPPDRHRRPKTQSLRTPRGSIKRLIEDDPKVSTRGLKDVWDEERERLLALVRKRNKEHGVQL